MRRKHFSVKCGVMAVLAVILAICLTWGLIYMVPKSSLAENSAYTPVEVPAGASKWDGDLIKAGWGTQEGEKPAEYVEVEASNTIRIGSAEAFAYFAHEVFIGAHGGFKDWTVKLECDIDLNNELWMPIGVSSRKKVVFSGENTNAFLGTFDGGDYTVYNFSADKLYENVVYEDDYYVGTSKIPFITSGGEYSYGLFGTVGNATIKNLNIKNISLNMGTKLSDETTDFLCDEIGVFVGFAAGNLNIYNCTAGSLGHGDYLIDNWADRVTVGGLVGRDYAFITADGAPCTSSQVSNGGKLGKVYISDCVNYVNLTAIEANSAGAREQKAGGMVGYFSDADLEHRFVNCVNYGNITAGYAGGITSYWDNGSYGVTAEDPAQYVFEFDNCVNYGDIVGTHHVGGIFSRYQFAANSSKYRKTILVTDCVNYGDITYDKELALNNDNYCVGGIIGTIRTGVNTTITNCFNYGEVTGRDGVGASESANGGILGSLVATSRGASSYNLDYQVVMSGGNAGKVNGVDRFTENSCLGRLNNGTANVHLTSLEYVTMNFFDAVFNETNNAVPAGKAEYDGDIEFIYDENDNTVIKGINNIPEQNFAVTIPANVTKIGFGAFAGLNNLVEVNFAENGALTAIEDWAFAGTGIGEINVPAQVAKIGASAFGGCASLSNAVLSEGLTELGQSAFGNTPALHKVHVTAGSVPAFGKNVFDKGVYVIAENREHYDSLFEKNGTDYAEQLTFVVTIEYDYYGTILDTEYRLFNNSYAVQLNEETGEWIENPNPSLGTAVTGEALWYASNGSDHGDVLSVESLTEILAGESCGDVLTLYTFDAENVFVARTGIVYDGTEYGMDELNSLLTAASTPISPDMTAEIIAYTDADGVQATVLPNVIKNAGEYTVQVTVGEAEYSFNVTIGRATVDLASYNELAWRITQIDGEAFNNELRDGSGLILYIYKDGAGNEYPATSVLTGEQITELGLTGDYTTRTVLYSAVRNRNAEVTITIAGNEAFSVDYEGNTGKDVGTYTATATLTANNNYALTVGTLNNLRGIKIETDGVTATVTKQWYIVDLSNWLTNVTSESYNHTYLNDFTAVVPQIYYNNANGQNAITMRLYLGDTQIGQEFGPDEISSYINKVMPAGDYRLVVTVEGIISHEYDEADIEQENPIEVYHGGFSETVNFTVYKRELPQTALASLNSAIKGKTFTYVMDGNNHMYDGTANTAVNTFLGTPANESRTGTIWGERNYDPYYGDYVIEYNLLRMQSDNYSVSISTNETGLYTVYYRISAPNYYNSLEKLADGETRQSYYFCVVNVEEVEIPVLESKTYDGYTLKADITDGEYFTVKSNEGGVNADTYTVVLELRNPDYYMWKGQTLADKTAETSVDFVINKAPGAWSVAPNVIAWEYKGYSLNTNLILGSATGGSVTFRITTDENGENVYSGLDSVTLTEKDGIYVVSDEVASILKDMPAGTYYLTATMTPDGNHLETDALNVSFEVGQAVNSWNVSLGITTWVAGSYGELEEFPVTAEAKFGNVSVKLTDANDGDNVLYEGLNGTDELAEVLAGLGAGRYVLTATVAGVSDFGGLNDFIIFSVFAPEGLAWWVTLLIVAGALILVALVLFVLHQKGVLQLLTGKFVIAMRTKATVDATIAAVRANKVAERAKITVAEAEAKEAEEARRKEIEAAKARPIEEQAADLDEKARTAAETAKRIQQRAEEMQAKAAKMKEGAVKQNETGEPENGSEENK